jgi:hypothetical protein
MSELKAFSAIQPSEYVDYDAETLTEAKQKNSPHERMKFFEMLFSQITRNLRENTQTSTDILQESRDIRFNLNGIRQGYQRLFGKDMFSDVPGLEFQFNSLNERFPEGVPSYNLGFTFDQATKHAPKERDNLQIP